MRPSSASAEGVFFIIVGTKRIKISFLGYVENLSSRLRWQKNRAGLDGPTSDSINPLDTIASDMFEDYLLDFLGEHEDVKTVVFGLPTHADGHITRIGEKVQKIIQRTKQKCPLVKMETIDEAFTSKDARIMMVHLGVKKKQREKKANVDRMSAVLILKSYLDSL